MQVVAGAVEDEEDLLGDVAVATAVTTRLDLLHHEVEVGGGRFGPGVEVEAGPPLAGLLHRAVGGADHPRRLALDSVLLDEAVDEPVVARR